MNINSNDKVNFHRFYHIDLLRFIAAIAVVLFHYTFRGFAANDFSPLEFPFLGQLFKYGYLGVELFFMISGFVILMSAQKSSTVKFIIGRLSRLYPAFWISVSFTALVSYYANFDMFMVSWIDYLKNLSMISGFFYVRFVDGVYWTLLVELKFYFIIFTLLAIGKIHHYPFFIFLWLTLISYYLLIGLPNSIEFFIFPEYASYFMAGSLFYLISEKGANINKYLLLTACYFLSLYNAIAGAKELSIHYSTFLSSNIVILIISMFFLIFLLISNHKLVKLNSKKFIFFGSLTYPLYLIHQNVGYILFNVLAPYVNKYFILIGTLLTMIYVAYLINRYIENIFGMKMKQMLELQPQYFGKK